MAEVASANFFKVLDAEASEAPDVTPKQKEKPKAEAPATRGGQRGRSGPASKGGRYYQRGGGAAQSAAREPAEAEDPPQGKRSDDRPRGRGRGGRARGGRGRGGHGRDFDRHSATDRVDTEKQIGQGWGANDGGKEWQVEEQAAEDAAATPADDPWATPAPAAAAAADDGWGVPAADASGDAAKDGAPAETRRPREEEEDKTLTLDEFYAQQKEKEIVPKLEGVRKANDGNDDLFKDAVQVTKDVDEDAYFVLKPKNVKQRAKKDDKKQPAAEVTDIFFTGQFSDRAPRGRGVRGGERGFRGGRGRGGRGGRGRGDSRGADNQGVNFGESDFPSLGEAQ
ncbi:uncharacterized protein FOMMEDRAFT_133292 [Fomitiporia mediterranea MF3/22]|uniref:uncharacterized protein n=1 Tax=Fomitiporia mediterranea (strain MF3/22) TaxID=694068 RepID=UPI00044095DD|nr:uncharacterized protein FOMMEDRAFT_133292 [Fomitiporia mediterranea MF3/22]EJD03930.1 hypothetical protein FOMMEDRAFT_133292 [Fomitiporia mediterranea MF3/22]